MHPIDTESVRWSSDVTTGAVAGIRPLEARELEDRGPG